MGSIEGVSRLARGVFVCLIIGSTSKCLAQSHLDGLVEGAKSAQGSSFIEDQQHDMTAGQASLDEKIGAIYSKPNIQTESCSDIGTCGINTLFRHEAGSKSIPLQAIVPPMNAAVVDRLNDPNSIKIVTDNINSIGFLNKLTYTLAEPSVGSAINASMLEAETHTGNVVLSDLYTMKAAERFPAAQPFVEAYFHCMQKQLSKLLPMGFAQANSYCRYDRTVSSTGSLTNPLPVPVLLNHPGWDPRDGGLGTKISLTDIIFNEESSLDPDGTHKITLTIPDGTSTGTTIDFNPINPADLTDKLATDFVYYFGDIEYEISMSPTEWGTYLLGQGGGLKARYTILDPQIDPSFEYSFLTHQIFDYLRYVLWWYCQYLGEDSSVGTQDSTFDSFFNFASDPFNAFPQPIFTLNLSNLPDSPIVRVDPSLSVLGQAGFDRLSIPGFMFPPVLIAMMGEELNDFPPNPVPGPGSGKFDCRPLENEVLGVTLSKSLFPGVLPTPIESWINGYSPTVWPLPAGVYPALSTTAGIRHYFKGSVPDVFKMMFFLSRRLALGQILSRAKIARDVIGELSSSLGTSVPTAIINDAYKLIGRATGVNAFDLESAIAANLEDLQAYTSAAYVRLQERTEKARSNLQ